MACNLPWFLVDEKNVSNEDKESKEQNANK